MNFELWGFTKLTKSSLLLHLVEREWDYISESTSSDKRDFGGKRPLEYLE